MKNLNARLIVITGGPGAGKTAILEVARKTFCHHVAVLPEAASIVFGGGFWRQSQDHSRRAAQIAIFHVQRQLERMVIDEGKANIILCDRGTLDGLAYWPGKEEEFFREIGSSREKELARYSGVIHLRTPLAEHGYNHANPLRIETAKEAMAIDERILKCWEGHPSREVINGTTQFLEKADRAISMLRKVIACSCSQSHPVRKLKSQVR